MPVSLRHVAATFVVVVAGTTATTAVGTANAALTTPRFTVPAEAFAKKQLQTTCNPVAKPGVVRFARMVLAGYPGTSSAGIVRACDKGGRSEHKEGRAWDWWVDARDPAQRAQAHDLLRWLFASDARGVQAANARRLGVMYVIYDGRVWASYAADSGWRPYRGRNRHTDHMHVSFSRAGANATTSFFRAGGATTPTRTGRLPDTSRTAPPPTPLLPWAPAAPSEETPIDDDPAGNVDGYRSDG